MRLRQRVLTILLSLALVPSTALVSSAQYQQDQEENVSGPQGPQGGDQDRNNQPDPPTRAARLQYMSGSVSVQPHGTEEWAAGMLNRPLTNSDNIWADKNSRAEVNVGTGLIRLDSESSLTLTNIGDNAVQLQLHQGAMTLHVRRLYDGETYEVDTPNQAFTIARPGDYRFDVDSDSDKTVITVWRGEGESTGDGPAVRIREGQQARFADGTNTSAADLHSAPSLDEFDQWSSARDERFDHSASARYVSPDVVGSEDLDEYGSWRSTPDYGSVWVPSRVDVGWAPYRNGHWIWVSPWGWTWVEDEPWGYAPFHYGRWVYYNNYWGWAPGPIYVRPYYAPALVAWFGGGGWGVGVGFGGRSGYGWCPLGFGEPYIPSYGVSRGYFNHVNVSNTRITNITNVYNNTYINNRQGRGEGDAWRNNVRYANMHSPNGFTAVNRETMLNSQSVSRNALRVSPNEISRVSPVRSLDMKPTRTTMLGANSGRMTAAPPPRSFVRPVVSRSEMSAGARGNAGANVGFGKGSQPNWNGISQRPGVGMNSQRPNMPMNNSNNNNAGQRPMGNNGAIQRPAEMERPSPNNNVRVSGSGTMPPRSVPRPPSAGGVYNPGSGRGVQNNGVQNNGVQNNDRAYGNGSYNRPQGGYGSNSGSQSRPAPSNQGNYSRPSPSPSPSYSRPQPNNGGGNYSRPSPSPSYSRPQPNNGGGNYSRPAPSYERAPAQRPMPSYGGGGGGGRSMGSNGGGGGRAPAYNGGGGHQGGNGGGRAAAPSGGGGHNDNGRGKR